MIQIQRPVYEVNKPLKKVEGKSLENQSFDEEKPYIDDIDYIQDNETQFTEEELRKAVSETNKMILGGESHFEFQVHEKTGTLMVKLVDNETKEVIKEIPPEKILDLVANIWELVGIIVDERG